jgi:hypothetical protein
MCQRAQIGAGQQENVGRVSGGGLDEDFAVVFLMIDVTELDLGLGIRRVVGFDELHEIFRLFDRSPSREGHGIFGGILAHGQQ